MVSGNQGNDSASDASARKEQICEEADQWYEAGYNVLPMKADKRKAPAVGWKKYQTERIPESKHYTWFEAPKYHGLAIVGGVAFGDQIPLELYEFETRKIWQEWWTAVKEHGLQELANRIAFGYTDESGGGGIHLLYRCEEVGKGVVLAADEPDKVLIETKGRNHLIIVAPTFGSVHEDADSPGWRRLKGGPGTVETITLEERERLFELARTFDRRPPEEAPKGNRPGDVYAVQGPPIEELIEAAGWSPGRTDGEVTYWTRPGKSPAEGVSASLGRVRDDAGNPLLHVFTSSAAPFEQDKNYNKFAVYAYLEHNGDFKAAAKALAAEGYGEASSKLGGPKEPPQAQELLMIAKDMWELVWWDEGNGEPFAIEIGGPNIAYPMRGSDSFRAALSSAYADLHDDRPPSNEALSQAILVLEHRARRSEPRRLWIRVAQPERGVIHVDMGDKDGRVVEITSAGWEILPRSPVTFRRTAATRPLPEPDRDGNLDDLWRFTRFEEKHRPLVKAWLVHAFYPDDSHAILRVTGSWDSGKTYTCRFLAATIDPALATFRGWGSKTRDIRDWVAHVTSSWVSGLDNISYIDPDLDDALCRSSTSDAVRDRKYFTQGDVDIKMFKRVVLFNDISLGLIKGDLVDRLLEAAIPRLHDKDAIEEEELMTQWEKAYPGIVGGLFNYIVRVLKELKSITRPEEGWPRPRGFSRVLQAVDRVDKTSGMATWREMKDSLKANLAQGDLVALCLVEMMQGERKAKTGTSTDWLKWLDSEYQKMTDKDRAPTDKLLWPQTVQGMSNWFRRLVANMPTVGVELTEKPRQNNMERTKWEAKWLGPAAPPPKPVTVREPTPEPVSDEPVSVEELFGDGTTITSDVSDVKKKRPGPKGRRE